MLNIYFFLFLFAILMSLSAKAVYRLVNGETPLHSKEHALFIALSVGCLCALSAGVSSVYHVQLFI